MGYFIAQMPWELILIKDIQWLRFFNSIHVNQTIKAQKNPLTDLTVYNEAKLRHPNYKHNGLIFTTMINILGSSGKFKLMEEVGSTSSMASTPHTHARRWKRRKQGCQAWETTPFEIICKKKTTVKGGMFQIA